MGAHEEKGLARQNANDQRATKLCELARCTSPSSRKKASAEKKDVTTRHSSSTVALLVIEVLLLDAC